MLCHICKEFSEDYQIVNGWRPMCKNCQEQLLGTPVVARVPATTTPSAIPTPVIAEPVISEQPNTETAEAPKEEVKLIKRRSNIVIGDSNSFDLYP